ncbi:MAG: UDP-2,3-diacylglucosamine diphosphatase [Burkholderiales bacterium]
MARWLFISDLHLTGERPEANEQFFRFLSEEAAGAHTLCVLGDLFEYWIGDDELDAPDGDPLAHEAVRALRALTDSGVPVHFMAGNRDFLIGSGFTAATGVTILEDPTVLDVAGVRTLLMHGDTLCTDDHDYQAWRRTARAEKWQREFLGAPLAERRARILQMREKSRQVVAAKPAEIMDVNPGAVRDAFRTHDVRRLIHGHTHRSAFHAVEVNGARCERWVLPDWYGDGGGYLAVDEMGAHLISF